VHRFFKDMKPLRSKYFSPAVHITIWILLLAVPAILFRNRAQTFYGLNHWFFFLTSLYHIGIFYLNAYFLYPALVTKKRWWLYIISLAVVIVASNKLKIYLLSLNPAFQLTDDNKRVIFFSILPFIVASIFFRLISDRIMFERLEKEARAQRMDAELKFLRSQVSPHFLFNMMTNMVALARQQSDLLEPSLIKLSDLLRYMLYDSAEQKIAVGNEIDSIKNYVALQQLRFGEDVRIDLKIENDRASCFVEPMLLVPFIENAFKHGIGLLKDPYIKIKLRVHECQLAFEVINNFNAANLSKDKKSGIGLANVKNRLALLYSGKYKLEIDESGNVFSVQLNLDLS
jgi:two-component system LytT family sensor kinase